MKKFCSLTTLVSCALFTQQGFARITTHQSPMPTRQKHHATGTEKQTLGTRTRSESSPYTPKSIYRTQQKTPTQKIIPISHNYASKTVHPTQLTAPQREIAKRIAVAQTNIMQTSSPTPAPTRTPVTQAVPLALASNCGTTPVQNQVRTPSRDVSVHAAVAVAELIDKITILEIKLERIADQAKLTNIRAEYDVLKAMFVAHVPQSPELEKLKGELIAVNKRLWALEDAVRAKESSKTFDAEFVRIARDIYLNNDERGLVKRDINALVGSHIIEEKSYGEYRTDDSTAKRSWSESSAPKTQAQSTITVTVEMPVGELLDKITVLEIKQENITNPDKLKNVKTELAILYETIAQHVAQSPELTSLIDTLRTHNKKMWGIQDQIREKERVQQFDDSFIQLARAVYFTNDARCAVKREINMFLGSRLIEEKKYTEYKA